MSRLETFADAIVASTKHLISKSIEGLGKRLDELERWRTAHDHRPVEQIDIEEIVAKVLLVLPIPRDGKDADVDEIVARVLERIPKPKDGVDGRDGKDGVDGKDGAPGKDGIDGKDGAPGIDGKDGAAGRDGKDGAHGKDGRDGIDGKDGARGADGKDGIDGKDGSPGRDALEIDILPAIEEGKVYPRGIFAHWNGGIVRSFRTTNPVGEYDDITECGWAHIWRGLHDIQILQSEEDVRTFSASTVMSDNKVRATLFSIPAQIYRGVWKEGEFVRGDTVTLSGSTWHCNRETTDRPGTSDAWTLSVKKGTDGRDGKPGEKGEKGATGRAGRDLTQLGFDGSKH
jgi:hypothetical protein